MRVWLLHSGETLPIDGNIKLYRYGILADMLSKRNHNVVRWAPSFSHATKKQRVETDKDFLVNKNYLIKLLHVPGYQRHVGFKRYKSHKKLAKKFRILSLKETPPDVIISGIPIPQLCYEAIRYGSENKVPVIIDVRDVWPDAFLHYIPWIFHPIVKKIFSFFFEPVNRYIFQNATGIIGITDGFLKWGLSFANRPKSSFDGIFYMGYPDVSFSENDLNLASKKLNFLKLENERFRFCYTGVFGGLYDFKILIKAAEKLHNMGYNCDFIIAGDGPKLNYYKELSKNIPNIHFIGWINAPEVEVLMSHSAVGVIPYKKSAITALPNKAIAYFSKGLPLLTSEGGELSEIIKLKKCGIVYKVGDMDSFVQKCILLIKDRNLLGKLSNNAVSFFQNELLANKIYDNLINYLEKIAYSAR